MKFALSAALDHPVSASGTMPMKARIGRLLSNNGQMLSAWEEKPVSAFSNFVYLP
jgi:hypothetical protein